MSQWEPATEVEAALRDALRAEDQERYFQILSRAELLLPISVDAMAGRAPMGWGTWTTSGRTHVLAFTSEAAMRICLADGVGSAHRMPYRELAAVWPNLEWWLAVNPGLPIEGYLPAWYVAQLSRGDVRLPGRTLAGRARLEQIDGIVRARAAVPASSRIPPDEQVVSPAPRPESDLTSSPDLAPGKVPLARNGEAADGLAAGSADVEPVPPDFVPANDLEQSLLNARRTGSTHSFLSNLLLARVLLPVPPGTAAGVRPGQEGFPWQTAIVDGGMTVAVFTSPERLAEHLPEQAQTIKVKFAQLIRYWPDSGWSCTVNPGSPVGVKLPGSQIVALASWATEVGLGGDTEEVDLTEARTTATGAQSSYGSKPPDRPMMMQKTIAPEHVNYYLERGYDRVCGFVHRANEVAHLTTPAELIAALGLAYPDSPFRPDADEVHVLRWPVYRPNLYRIPYGGQTEAAMRAMEGWVIERPPFRGNGFAPGGSDVIIAEFKVDSVRLPHGAQLWRIGADGSERLVATLDSDACVWRRTSEVED